MLLLLCQRLTFSHFSILQSGFDVAINISASPGSGLVDSTFVYTLNM